MLIRVIDFECTGLEPPAAAICEIGWCDVAVRVADPTTGLMQPTIGDPMSFLVNPGHPMPPEARAVHHISDADIEFQAAYQSPAEGLRALVEGQKPDYFVAHYAKYEQQFFDGAGIPFICTYKVALRFWPDAPAHSNQVLRYWLPGLHDAIDCLELAAPPHRAAPDAYVTAHILAHMILEGKADLETMARWSAGPPLLPKITFGKHFGKKWEDVPTDYLDWIVFKSDMDGDIKANAKHHLKARGVKA